MKPMPSLAHNTLHTVVYQAGGQLMFDRFKDPVQAERVKQRKDGKVIPPTKKK